MLEQQKIGSFNPFKRKYFKCPVCGSDEFVELNPNGGVWCKGCNAAFGVRGTCDGIDKVAVDCFTKDVWNKSKFPGISEHYWTVLWADDKKMSWLTVAEENGKRTVKNLPIFSVWVHIRLKFFSASVHLYTMGKSLNRHRNDAHLPNPSNSVHPIHPRKF